MRIKDMRGPVVVVDGYTIVVVRDLGDEHSTLALDDAMSNALAQLDYQMPDMAKRIMDDVSELTQDPYEYDHLAAFVLAYTARMAQNAWRH